MRFAPPLTVTDAEIDEAVAIFATAIGRDDHAPLPRRSPTSTPTSSLDVLAPGRGADPVAGPSRSTGHGVALIFEKPSTRTRHSMEIAVVQLGGHPVYTRGDEVGFDVREPVEDVARILAGYHGVIAARVFDHCTVQRLADAQSRAGRQPAQRSRAPDAGARRRADDAAGARSRSPAARSRGSATTTTSPARWRRRARCSACTSGSAARSATRPTTPSSTSSHCSARRSAEQLHRPVEAVAGADVVHTDVFTSMGQEAERAARDMRLRGLPGHRGADGRRPPTTRCFLHCLPAYRGEEVTAEVIDGPAAGSSSRATTACHAARGLLAFLYGRARERAMSKVQRQQAIAKLVGQHAVTNQPQLVDLLAGEGIIATQATVSRDLDDLGAIKVRVPGGESVYAIPDYEPARLAPEDQLRRVMGEWVAEVRALRQPRRRAHAARLRPCRRVGARPHRHARAARHRRRRRHAAVRRRPRTSAATRWPTVLRDLAGLAGGRT